MPDYAGHRRHPDEALAFRLTGINSPQPEPEQVLSSCIRRMQYARSMALVHVSEITLCPLIDPSGQPPQCGGHFGQGLAAIKQNGEDSELLSIWSPVAGVTVTNRIGSSWVTGALRWDQEGIGRRNLTLSVCARGHNWSVITNRLGRPRLARDWGVCPSAVAR
jgi:hypothetical protein